MAGIFARLFRSSVSVESESRLFHAKMLVVKGLMTDLFCAAS